MHRKNAKSLSELGSLDGKNQHRLQKPFTEDMLELPDVKQRVNQTKSNEKTKVKKDQMSDQGFLRHIDSGLKRLDDIENDLADVISVPAKSEDK